MKQRNLKFKDNIESISNAINNTKLLGKKIIDNSIKNDKKNIHENKTSLNENKQNIIQNELNLNENKDEILVESTDSLTLNSNKNENNERMIDYLDNNQELKLLFSKYEELSNEVVYNKNYDYKIYSPDLTTKLIDSNWNNPQYIFRNNKIKFPEFKSIKDIKKIKQAHLINGRLIYEVTIDNINKSFNFKIEDCLSKELFFLVKEYLFIEAISKKVEISNSVKYFEVTSYFHNFGKKLKGLNIKDCIIPRISKRTNKISIENRDILESIELKSILNIFLTNENTLVYYVKLEKGKFYITQKDLDSKLDEERKNLLEDMIYKKQIIPRYERTNEITYLYRNNTRQYSKDNKKKFLAKLKADSEKNHNNCLIHALQLAYNCFKVYKHKNEFRSIGFEAQLVKVNSILLENGKKSLHFNKIIKANLGNFIKEQKGVALVIYYKDINSIHADIFKNGSLLGDRQENYDSLSNENVSMIIMEIEDHEIEDKV